MKKEKSHVELSTLEIKMPGQELLKHIYEHGQSAPYDITDVVAKSIVEHFLRTNEVLTFTHSDGKEYVLNIERVEDNKEPEPKKVYLSGPITSLPLEDACAMFLRSEKHLRGYGFSVVNPMNNGLSPDSSWEEHMRKDIALLLDCDYICLLPNYRQSKGAMIELYIATALQMTVINHSDDGNHAISLAEKHLNDTIEEPSRTLEQSFVDYIRYHAAQHDATPYAKIQLRADFLSNFKDGWELFNTNVLFRHITYLVMDGASVYDMMLELVFMINGQCTPEASHLASQPNAGTLGADAPNKKI